MNCRPDILLDTEKFQYITDKEIKGIIPNRYMVSNYGFMCDMYRGISYPNQNFTSGRYVYVRVELLTGEKLLIGLHILILRVFNYIDGCEKLQVNHKDGIKYHNWIWNLEWATCSQNIKHSYDIGLHKYGEDSTCSKFTNEQIKMICDLLSKGYRTKDIISKLNPYMNGLNIKIAVDAIKSGKYWNHISKDYDLTKVYRNKFLLETPDINKICEIFQELGTNIQYKELLNMIGFDYSSLSEKELIRVKEEISLLRRKKTKKEICEQYNY